MEPSQIRARARQSLSGHWPLAIGAAALVYLLGGLITGNSFFPKVDSPEIREFSALLNQFQFKLGSVTFSFRGGIWGFIAFLIGGPVQLGYARFLLKQYDGQREEFSDLFSQFHRFGQGFAQHFLCSLYSFLWCFLLIIPGIVAAYSYSMTPFLMAEDPTLSASDAISRSKDLMNGHKADLFLLDLTFLGWALLSAITLNLGYLALNPYTNAARAAFYRSLTGNSKPVLEGEIV